MTSPYLSIILPIYNEEERLRKCLDRLTVYLWNYTHYKFEILCVLNGCVDGSGEIAARFAGLWPQIRILELPDAGKGRAVKAGMLAADGTYRMMMDVDLATPPTTLPLFLEAARTCDLVTGSRRSRLRTNALRRAAHTGYRLLSRPLTNVHDPQCGFKMFRDVCAEDVFPLVHITSWGFDLEVLYLAYQKGWRISELDVPWEHDSGSKLRPFEDGLQMARDMLTIKRLHNI